MSKRLSDYADEDLLRELVRRARNRNEGARLSMVIGNISWSVAPRYIKIAVGRNLYVDLFIHDDVLEFLENGTASGAVPTDRDSN